MELGEELIKDARDIHMKHSELDNVVLCGRKSLKKIIIIINLTFCCKILQKNGKI